MKKQVCNLLILCCLAVTSFAQTDTTIYTIVEEMPRFYNVECEALETNNEKKQCSDKKC